jgi:hypothetical protein
VVATRPDALNARPISDSVVSSGLIRERTDDTRRRNEESGDTHERRTEMGTVIGTFAAFVFVVGTLTVVGWALFEMSPFARHKDEFRDPRTGKFRGSSPRLD